MSLAIFRRSSPRTLWTIFGLSAAKASRSPSFAPVRSMSFGGDRLDELGDAGVEAAAGDLRDRQALGAEALGPLGQRVGLACGSASTPPGTTMHFTIGAFLKT